MLKHLFREFDDSVYVDIECSTDNEIVTETEFHQRSQHNIKVEKTKCIRE